MDTAGPEIIAAVESAAGAGIGESDVSGELDPEDLAEEAPILDGVDADGELVGAADDGPQRGHREYPDADDFAADDFAEDDSAEADLASAELGQDEPPTDDEDRRCGRAGRRARRGR